MITESLIVSAMTVASTTVTRDFSVMVNPLSGKSGNVAHVSVQHNHSLSHEVLGISLCKTHADIENTLATIVQYSPLVKTYFQKKVPLSIGGRVPWINHLVDKLGGDLARKLVRVINSNRFKNHVIDIFGLDTRTNVSNLIIHGFGENIDKINGNYLLSFKYSDQIISLTKKEYDLLCFVSYIK